VRPVFSPSPRRSSPPPSRCLGGPSPSRARPRRWTTAGISRFVDLLAGARYMSNRAGLAVERDGDAIAGTEKSLGWVDALAGVRVRLPLGGKVALHARGDVAGLGSDFSWNLQGGFEVALGNRWKTGAGYRYLDVDYDKGQAADRRIWKTTYQGPYLFFAYAW
jgi:hypothetical protein